MWRPPWGSEAPRPLGHRARRASEPDGPQSQTGLRARQASEPDGPQSQTCLRARRASEPDRPQSQTGWTGIWAGWASGLDGSYGPPNKSRPVGQDWPPTKQASGVWTSQASGVWTSQASRVQSREASSLDRTGLRPQELTCLRWPH